MAAGSIVIDLLMKTGSFETDTKRAAKVAEKSFKDIQNAYKGITDSFAGNLLNDAFQKLVGTLTAMPAAILNGLDALNDVADATGATIENISALEDVAARTGATIDDVSSILVKFNAVLNEVDGKNGASQALKALGLDAEELKKIDPAEALRQTAAALAEFADDGNKARIIQELFGKSVKDAAPFLKDLAEQTELTATVTAKQAQAAEDFNKVMFELQKNTTDLARDLAGPLLESLNSVIKSFKDARAAGKSFMEIQSDSYWKWVKDFYGMGGDAPEMGGAVGSWGDPEAPMSAARPSLPSLPAASKPKKTARETQSDFDRYLDSLKKQVDRTKELTEVEQVLSDIQEGRAGKISDTQKATLLGLAEQVDMHKRLKEQIDFEGEGYKFLQEEQRKLGEEAARVFEQTRTPFENYMQDLERLDFLLKEGKITADTYTRATKQIGDQYVQSGEKAKEAADAFTEFSKQAERNIQDALGDTLEDALSGNFDNIGKMWGNLIQKMAAQALAAQLNNALFGGKGGGGGGGGINWSSLLTSAFSAFAGSTTGSVGNAGQGDYKAYYDSLAGYATGIDYVPEDGLYKLHKGETVTPVKYTPAGGMGMGAKFDFSGQTINVGAGVSPGQVATAIKASQAESEAKWRRSMQQQRSMA